MKQVIEGRNDYTIYSHMETKLFSLHSRASRLVTLLTNYSVDDDKRKEFHESYAKVEAEIDAVRKQMDDFQAMKRSATTPAASSLSTSSASSTNLDDVTRALNPMEICTPQSLAANNEEM